MTKLEWQNKFSHVFGDFGIGYWEFFSHSDLVIRHF